MLPGIKAASSRLSAIWRVSNRPASWGETRLIRRFQVTSKSANGLLHDGVSRETLSGLPPGMNYQRRHPGRGHSLDPARRPDRRWSVPHQLLADLRRNAGDLVEINVRQAEGFLP